MLHYLSRTYASIGLFRKAFGRYKKIILILAGFGFLSGILGGIGIGAIIPLFSFVGGQSGVANDAMSALFKMIFNILGIPFTLSFVIAAIVSLFIFKAFFLFMANIMNAKAVADYNFNTRNELLGYTMRARWQYLLNRKIGYLTQVVSEDVDFSAGVLVSISTCIIFLTSLISYAAVALSISPLVTVITILIGAILSFLLKPIFYRVRSAVRQETGLKKEVAHFINQYLLGAKTIKATVAELPVMRLAREKFGEISQKRFTTLKYQAVMSNFLEPVTLAVVIPVFLFSYQDPSFNIASFAAVLYLVQKMFSFIQSMQLRLNAINEGIPHLAAVVDCSEEAQQYQETAEGLDSFQFSSEIKFEDVGFSYDHSERAISGLAFSIQKGNMIGLIGLSGSGKTTVADLLLRFFQPTEGKITVDGLDISHISLSAWRKKIGYVSQDAFLLNDTIANNIRFYNKSITDDDIKQAAQLAHIDDFVAQRPDAFETVVGERGVTLSAGQRQRIVLARVIAQKPEILILDEATSALDNESEAAIQKSLDELRGKVTMLVIAHRLSTVMNSDTLAVLDGGTIIERGKPEELLRNTKSRFFSMYHVGKSGNA